MHDNRDSHRRHDRTGHQPSPSDTHDAPEAQAGDASLAESHGTDSPAVGAEAGDTAAIEQDWNVDTASQSSAKDSEMPAPPPVEETPVVPPADDTTPADLPVGGPSKVSETASPDRVPEPAPEAASESGAADGGDPDISQTAAQQECKAADAEVPPVTATEGEGQKEDVAAAPEVQAPEAVHEVSSKRGEDTKAE